MKRWYGHKKDEKDTHDHKFALSWPSVAPFIPLPPSVDLEPWCPPVLDQGQTNTCTVHACTEAMRYDYINTNGADLPLSRNFAYHQAGLIEGDTSDDGRQIRDVVKGLATAGVCKEELWPFDEPGSGPSSAANTDASGHKITDYQSVAVTAQGVKDALFVGRPVIIGVEVFSAFEEDLPTGIIPIPGMLEGSVGSHCMLAIGYGNGYIKVRNSWGPDWGAMGNCFLPEQYIEKYGSDFWVINTNT
jgi:C1A family cysteine protease